MKMMNGVQINTDWRKAAYRFMNKSLPSGFLVTTAYPEFNMLYVNDTLLNMLEFDTAEEFSALYCNSALNFVHKDDLEYVMIKALEQKNIKDANEISFRILKKDGNYIWINRRSQYGEEDDGKEVIFSYYRDITEQKKTEKLLYTALQGYDASVWEWDILSNKASQTIYSSRCSNKGGNLYENFPQCLFENNHYHEDSIELAKSLFDRILGGEKVVEADLHTYDARTKEYWWENVCYSTIFGKNGEPIRAVAIGRNITHQKKIEEMVKETSEKYEAIVNTVPGGIAIYEVTEKGVITTYYNNKFCDLFGYSRQEFEKIVKEDAIGRIFEEDAWIVKKQLTQAVQNKASVDCKYRAFRKDGSLVWVRLRAANYTEKDGNPLFYAIFTDISDEIEKDEQIKIDSLKFKALIESIPGGVGLYTIDENLKVKVSYFNDAIPIGLGYTREEYVQITDNEMNTLIHKEDLEDFYNALALAVKERNNLNHDFRVILKNGTNKWIHVTGTRMLEGDDKPVYCAVFIGIDSIKKAEFEQRMQRQKTKFALHNSNTYVWDYDFESRCIIQEHNSQKAHGLDEYVNDVPESLINSGYIHKDSAEKYREMYRKLYEGEETASGDFLVQNVDKNGYWVERIVYTTVFSDDGKPYCAIGVGKNVTDEVETLKNFEQRYNAELEYRKAVKSDKLLASIHLNLTKDVILAAEHTWNLMETYNVGNVFTENFNQIENDINDSTQRKKFSEVFAVENLILSYKNGERVISYEYKRKMRNGHMIWVSTTAKLLGQPNSKDIMCFIYTYDINEQNITNTMIDTVLAHDYDYICYVEAVNNSYIMYAKTDNGTPLPPSSSNNYTQEIENYARKYVVEEEADKNIFELSFENIFNQLKDKPVYNVFAGVKEPDGTIRRKKVQCSYIDKKKKIFMLTRSDITDIYQEEKQKNEVLRNALASAEQANNAKSEFLSRMSHEIRTPMNAIIGMSTLAAQCVNSPDQVSDCLSKVGISARFLLSLINDILDMSRIESGKISIKQEKIPFESFINGINAISYTQAQEKGVDFESIVTSYTENFYIGDAMKLQQIIINIISNAIKFTPEGGRVQFIVNQEWIKNGKALLRFTINDTGIGIKESFMPYLFSPFEQGNNGGTILYGGTGLGLAICKNLVDLMHGKIEVNSIEGVGTEFTVKIELSVSEESKKLDRIRALAPYNEMKALIVDDDVVICHHTERILLDMGMKAEWVDSGEKAIVLVKEKWTKGNYYNIILVDWKMPVLDGIETTRRIREFVGPDVTIIIMTSYDWVSIEQEALSAGVNMLITKPLFRDSLSRVFEKIFVEKEIEKEPKVTIRNYDFTGKRVLLVEDHVLNIEVAKRLLNIKNMEVDVAENGLQAIETFAKASAGYYDAILMDIRMPIMDGITAAKSIRHMKNKDAKTIPIIAMTANAFGEDVDKTKEAGMNAHLAKPIEPVILYKTLHQVIYV